MSLCEKIRKVFRSEEDNLNDLLTLNSINDINTQLGTLEAHCEALAISSEGGKYGRKLKKEICRYKKNIMDRYAKIENRISDEKTLMKLSKKINELEADAFHNLRKKEDHDTYIGYRMYLFKLESQLDGIKNR